MKRALVMMTLSLVSSGGVFAQELRLGLTPSMVINESDVGEPAGLVDEQDKIIGPPAGKPDSSWKINTQHNKKYPFSAHLDLGKEKNLSKLWLFDTHDKGDLIVSVGKPGSWKKVATYDCGRYMAWVSIPLDVSTRFIRLTRMTPGAMFTEVAVYEYSAEAWAATLARKASEAKERAEREAALRVAEEEMRKRPLVDLGSPFGKCYLVDEVDCANADSHLFQESPAGVSSVKQILGRSCRVLKKTAGESAFFTYRVGTMKLLQPGAAYVLSVEYPEDAPRSMVVMNSANECSRGFHTGRTFGDALHAKYVNSNSESINVPLSGKYESWRTLFHLHDRFPDKEFLRGDKERILAPDDGFTVTIAQFSKRNVPASMGAAVSRIRLFAIPDESKLKAALALPPSDLPRRHLFWREEMADGVIGSKKNLQRGISDPLDWYRFKAKQMQFLGMNTYSKDLLEFGACQHWDPTEGGGNDWVFHNNEHKHLWSEIVDLMGGHGFNVLPYYEYSGSKGYKGLGPQRRAKPLTRDDAYTHIKWIETSNADVTDPETYADFSRMLDLTILKYKEKANFVGAWIRPRSQMPMSFGDAALKRFDEETKTERPVSRKALVADTALLERYYEWWYGKRHQFLVAMRDHLRKNGMPSANVLFTASPGEPGVSFPSWDPTIVTDDPEYWRPVLEQQEHIPNDRKITPLSLQEVLKRDMYHEALLAPRLTWGKWEVHHSSPPADPHRYKETDGVLFSHCFNRAYTVSSAKSLDAFRSPSGLAIVRHYALNENMMFDKADKPKLGYFVADFERAGPTCMLGEALAVANGDPWYIGYLVGNNFARGFPEYVRRFNQAFLALPAMPSRLIVGAASDPAVVVREIRTEKHGTWYALVNTTFRPVEITVKLPGNTIAADAVTGAPLDRQAEAYTASFYPCELKAWHIK